MTYLPNLPAGVWRHYKGHLYQVFGYGRDANDPDRIVVVYVGLELDDATPGPRINVRTVADFFAMVDADGETVEHAPEVPLMHPDRAGWKQRFTYCGPEWDGEFTG